jgi:hypothetical protein
MKKRNNLKNAVIFIALILITKVVLGQEYIPITKENARWIIRFDSNNSGWDDNLYEYQMSGDTLINAFEYKKVYYRDLVFTNYGPPYEPEGPYILQGFIRDDATNKKVYAINLESDMFSSCPENEEFLLYDFSYEIAETVDFCTFSEFYTGTITTIQVGYFGGFETMEFEISTGYSYFEGIGSEFGLFETMFEPVKKNSEYVVRTYLEDYCPGDTCNLIVSIPNIDEISSLVVFPIPANEVINSHYATKRLN